MEATIIASLIVLIFAPVSCSKTTYHIRPTSESPCHYDDCLTLSEYASNTSRYFNSTTVLQFLPGVHYLNESIVFPKSVEHLLLSGALPGAQSTPENVSSIVRCSFHSGIILINISVVELVDLAFDSCGSPDISMGEYLQSLNITVSIDTLPIPTLSALFIPSMHVLRCSFVNTYFPLFSNGSAIAIEESEFKRNNKRGAIVAQSSYLFLTGNNTFKQNGHTEYPWLSWDGGAINILNSTMMLEGLPLFVSNSATRGGAIAAVNSTIYVTLLQDNLTGFMGICSFIANTARFKGGAILLQDSALNHRGGFMRFIGNTAGSLGKISAWAMLPFSPPQREDGSGGAVAMVDSVWRSSSLSFLSNSATYGGAVYASKSLLILKNATFINNQAVKTVMDFSSGTDGGGALNTIYTSLNFSGTTHLSLNSAENSGGAIRSSYSTFIFADFTEISNNSIKYLPQFQNSIQPQLLSPKYKMAGGGMYAFWSFIVFYGPSAFQHNSAETGGGMHIESCTLSFKQCSTFDENSSKQLNYPSTLIPIILLDQVVGTGGGGIYAATSNISFQANVLFIRNFAEGNGGGIYFESGVVRDSHYLVFVGDTVFRMNKANVSGGGLHLVHSKLILKGRPKFKSEYSNSPGSGLFSEGNITHTEGITTDECNSLTVQHCKIDSAGRISFERNEAVQNGGGLSLQSAKLYLFGDANFTENVAGLRGGAINALQSRLEGNTQTTAWCDGIGEHSCPLDYEGNMTFESNKAGERGGALSIDETSLTMKGHMSFTANTAGVYGGVMNTALGSSVTFDGNNIFTKGLAKYGGAFAIDEGECTLHGRSSFVENSGVSGGAIHIQGSMLRLNGEHILCNNTAKLNGYGGAIHAERTSLMFQGSQSFINNSATYGGGIAITNYALKALVYISHNSITVFQGNHAKRHGAAMTVVVRATSYCASDLESAVTPSVPDSCFFQLHTQHCKPNSQYIGYDDERTTSFIKKQNAQFAFIDNFAEEGGHILYGSILDRCIVCTDKNYVTLGANAFSELARMPFDQYTSNVSSEPFQVCLCTQHEHNCSQLTTSLNIYPGQTVSIAAVAVGQVSVPVPGVVYAIFNESSNVGFNHLQRTQATSVHCTILQYTIHSKDLEAASLKLFAEGPCGQLGIPLTCRLNFLPCPRAFTHSQLSGFCTCDQRLKKYTNSCDIDRNTITRSAAGDFWIGFDDKSHDLVLHPHCPFDYCKTETVVMSPNSTDLQCAHSRSGMLCGGCKSGFSLNLGSSRCSSCSNWYLLLFLPLALAGIFLVLFLFVFRVTVSSGTTSGLILYANVVAVNRSIFYPSGNTNLLTLFIAWLNLDLGIETCLFNGLDMYARTWLQFIFPLYIWALVGLITLLSRYSMTVSKVIGPTNPISVLATLLLLSYTKLLRTIIATFSFTTLDYPNDRKVSVWTYDANVGFLDGKHTVVFVVSLLAFLVLFLPYTLLLLMGQWIETRSNHRLLSWVNNPKVRFFLDAYHAPYKNHHRYWVGLLLVLRSVLFVTSAIIDVKSPRDPSINLLVLAIACITLMAWIWNTGSMYKSWYNNVIESSFILNLAVLAIVSYQVKVDGSNQTAVAYTSMSAALVTFMAIVIYHLSQCISDSRLWRNTIAPKLRSLWTQTQPNEDSAGMEMQPVIQPRPVTTTFVELRESLLESLQ